MGNRSGNYGVHEMKNEEIKLAVREAKRFIEKANDCLKEREEYSMAAITGTSKSGSLRRASLDLTRQLAEMRKAS
jgi:F0F1-type ATP synthase epsilon subunit